MSRQEMINTLNEQMLNVSGHFRETGRNPARRNPLKTYLVEANVPGAAEDPQTISDFLTSDVIQIPLRVERTDDLTIHRVYAGKDSTEFWLDTLDERYWAFHTTGPATEADQAIRRLVNNSLKLDSTWLPSGYFEEWIPSLGQPRQITSKFSVRTGLYQESIPEDLSTDALVMKMGGPLERWRNFRETPALARTMALWSARVIRRDEDSDFFADDDVTASGKVTARGDSFEMHQQILIALRNQYSELIEAWESAFRLDWTQDHGSIQPTGRTAVIPFAEHLDELSLATLASSILEGGEPYRLFGTPRRQGAQRFVAKAVDLHTGGKLTLEFNAHFMRIYLSSNTCGNVLARLVTNLQHFFDARITLGAVQQ